MVAASCPLPSPWCLGLSSAHFTQLLVSDHFLFCIKYHQLWVAKKENKTWKGLNPLSKASDSLTPVIKYQLSDIHLPQGVELWSILTAVCVPLVFFFFLLRMLQKLRHPAHLRRAQRELCSVAVHATTEILLHQTLSSTNRWVLQKTS